MTWKPQVGWQPLDGNFDFIDNTSGCERKFLLGKSASQPPVVSTTLRLQRTWPADGIIHSQSSHFSVLDPTTTPNPPCHVCRFSILQGDWLPSLVLIKGIILFWKCLSSSSYFRVTSLKRCCFVWGLEGRSQLVRPKSRELSGQSAVLRKGPAFWFSIFYSSRMAIIQWVTLKWLSDL